MPAQDQPWTVLRLINWTKEYFAKAGISDARLAAEMLLAHVLKCRRIELYTRFEYLPTPDELTAYRELIARAKQHEPVAYLVGEKEFYSLRMKVTAEVLIPRPETEALVSEAVGHLRTLGRAGRVWDFCTGSGCVAVAIAWQAKDAVVLATDISPTAIEVAAQNVAAHKVGDRVRCRQADLLNLPPDCEDWRQCDVLTANPPYVGQDDEVAAEVRHEPCLALRAGPEGLDVIRPLVAGAGQFLLAGGKLVMEFGYGQADAVRDLIVATGAFAEPKILRDHQEIERVAVATRRP
jgi:release factor glutamine methyltransferase